MASLVHIRTRCRTVNSRSVALAIWTLVDFAGSMGVGTVYVAVRMRGVYLQIVPTLICGSLRVHQIVVFGSRYGDALRVGDETSAMNDRRIPTPRMTVQWSED